MVKINFDIPEDLDRKINTIQTILRNDGKRMNKGEVIIYLLREEVRKWK